MKHDFTLESTNKIWMKFKNWFTSRINDHLDQRDTITRLKKRVFCDDFSYHHTDEIVMSQRELQIT